MFSVDEIHVWFQMKMSEEDLLVYERNNQFN